MLEILAVRHDGGSCYVGVARGETLNHLGEYHFGAISVPKAGRSFIHKIYRSFTTREAAMAYLHADPWERVPA